MLSSSVLTPLSLLSVVVTSVPPLFCTGWTLATNMASSSLILATLLIGLDQYLAIVTPLHYHSIVGGRRLVCVCLSAWLSVLTGGSMWSLDNPELALLWPVILVAGFGLVSVAIIAKRVWDFNDCQEAAEELKLQIKEAKADLTSKGLKLE